METPVSGTKIYEWIYSLKIPGLIPVMDTDKIGFPLHRTMTMFVSHFTKVEIVISET